MFLGFAPLRQLALFLVCHIRPNPFTDLGVQIGYLMNGNDSTAC